MSPNCTGSFREEVSILFTTSIASVLWFSLVVVCDCTMGDGLYCPAVLLQLGFQTSDGLG